MVSSWREVKLTSSALDIDRDLLEEAVRVTGAPSKTVAVQLGLKALVDEATRRGWWRCVRLEVN